MRPFFFPVLIVVLFTAMLSSCFNVDTQPSVSLEEQWIADTTSISKYLKSKNITAMKDPSGVRFVIDSLGAGFPPKASSSVKFSYTGRLLSEVIFDQGKNTTSSIKDLIVGFQLGLSLMPAGTKARIYIPSGYGYGANVVNSIPANSNLIFEVQLHSVVTSESEKQQLASDTVAIDSYLAANSIAAIKDKSGLRYSINQVGTGSIPNLYSKIKITYTGKLLSNGTIFFTGSNGPTSIFDSRVINYIYAFQAGLQKMPVGSKATFYVPSGLGFGNQITQGTNVNVPANSNLVFEMELTEIVE
ncbi:MAG: FKBP-type peptidyl-prolyl cis-trans isomerase [Cyclobacteriaceae bacterium]